MTDQIRVVLVEDHPIVLRGIHALISDQPDIDVVGEASTASSALEQAGLLQPDVVVAPVRLGGTRSGIELCRSIKTACRTRVVVFTSYTRPVDVQVALLAGADAVVSKTSEVEDLLDAVRDVMSGRQPPVLGSGLVVTADPRWLTSVEALTAREEQILQLIVDGLTNPQIARTLTVEVSTVKTHVRNILRKLGIDTRRDLFGPAAVDDTLNSP